MAVAVIHGEGNTLTTFFDDGVAANAYEVGGSGELRVFVAGSEPVRLVRTYAAGYWRQVWQADL